MTAINFPVSRDNTIGYRGASLLSKAAYIWVVDPNFSMLKTEIAVKATVLGKVATEEIVPIQIKAHEYKQPEPNLTTYENGDMVVNWENKRDNVFTIEGSLDQHKKLRKFNGAEVSILIGDMNGNLLHTSSDGLTVEPLSCSFFYVQVQEWGAGFTTKLHVVLADNEEWDANGAYFKPSYGLNSIRPIVPLTIVNQTTVAATVFTIVVAYVSESMSDEAGVAITEMARSIPKESIACANTAAPTTWLTPSSAVETPAGSGQYVVTCATFTGGPCKIIPTATNLYKSAAVTIVAAS